MYVRLNRDDTVQLHPGMGTSSGNGLHPEGISNSHLRARADDDDDDEFFGERGDVKCERALGRQLAFSEVMVLGTVIHVCKQWMTGQVT
ncbi:hypothetical protein Y032_0642g1038 [Ancylostoma ceylanicum]|uniref:Uncharacterized protein n=1 Tax=Ancylostoma ceylanicum TaxID=53326 RepID=A0A016WJH4_9BILA|nr:hypothetical protein Y032_0642g1038 [Ancylostoma ceylanicum]